jgi:RNA polymerase sigma-70 factor (ECF subfamily)
MTGRYERIAAKASDTRAEDESLVRQFNDGDGAAFEKLAEKYAGEVSSLANRLQGWGSEVEDVVQDVFLAALTGLKKFRFDCSVKTWLFGITVNKCRSYKYRRMVRGRQMQRERERMAAEMKSNSGGLEEDRRQEVRKVVRRLPVKYREAVVLKYLEGLSTKEITEVLGISEGAFHTRLSRAREELGKELANIDLRKQ